MSTAAEDGKEQLPARRPNLERSEKFRIMVDSVLTLPRKGEPRWQEMTDEYFAEFIQAGFNTIMPSTYGKELDRVRLTAERAGRHGVFTIAWQRAPLHLYDRGEQWDRQRMVSPSGVRQDVYSPNMEPMWDDMTRRR